MVTIDIFGSALACLASHDWFAHCTEKKRSELIERFCALARECTVEECNLLFQLTRDFENLPLAMYSLVLENLVGQLPGSVFEGIKSIFVIPVAAEKDVLKLKSGSMIGHMLKTYLKYDTNISDGVLIDCKNNVSGLRRNTKRKKSLVIFCDDFIGTGKQASDCIAWYDKYKKDDDTVLFMTISILEGGLQKINELGYTVYHDRVHKKAISDNLGKFPPNALSVMEKIEKKLHIPNDYRFGFERSEALLAFEFRPPNNTFPAYWYKHKASRRKPVFER